MAVGAARSDEQGRQWQSMECRRAVCVRRSAGKPQTHHKVYHSKFAALLNACEGCDGRAATHRISRRTSFSFSLTFFRMVSSPMATHTRTRTHTHTNTGQKKESPKSLFSQQKVDKKHKRKSIEMGGGERHLRSTTHRGTRGVVETIDVCPCSPNSICFAGSVVSHTGRA